MALPSSLRNARRFMLEAANRTPNRETRRSPDSFERRVAGTNRIRARRALSRARRRTRPDRPRCHVCIAALGQRHMPGGFNATCIRYALFRNIKLDRADVYDGVDFTGAKHGGIELKRAFSKSSDNSHIRRIFY